MQRSSRSFLVLVALLVTAFVAGGPVALGAQAPPAGAQAPPAAQAPPTQNPAPAPQVPAPQGAAQARASSPIQGELIEVNADAKTFSVLADKAKVQFVYTDKTEVTGAKEGVAGLATMKGTRVTVHFTEASNIRTATRIQVEPRQAEAPPARSEAPPAR